MKNVLLVLVCALAFSANAQVTTLTLKDALTYALENKADAKKAKLQVENSEYKIQQVRSLALPQISMNSGLNYNPVLQKSVINGAAFGQPGTVIQASFGQGWISNTGATLSQTLFDETVFTGLKAAKSTREFYQINEKLTDELVIEKVANNYYGIYVQRQKLILIDSNYVNTTKVRNVIEGQYKNGLAKKIDLDRINVKLSNISTQRQQILNDAQLQENSLKFFMGMPIETQIVIPQSEFEIPPLNLSDTPNTANRSEYLLLKKQEELLNYQKLAIKAEYYPKLTLNASFNYLGQGKEIPLFAKPADGVYWSNYSTIGLGLKVPIFTGFSTRSRVRQADIDIRSLKEDIKDTQLSLDLDYQNAVTQIKNSIITFENQKENKVLANEILKNTKSNYLQGLATLTDLLDAENAYLESENNYTTSILGFKVAEIRLIKSKGELKNLVK